MPKPRRLPSGTWYAQMMIKGEMVYISAASEKEYFLKARAAKSGMIDAKKAAPAITLRAACNQYIERRSAVLSPSTIAGYQKIVRIRFTEYMPRPISKIDWQKMVNDESANVSAKTIRNAWGFVKAVLKEQDIPVPNISLPQVVRKELPWLQPEQIPVFLDAIKGQPCEMGALLALHGLRRSEVLAVTPAHVHDGVIYVEQSAVQDSSGEFVIKDTTKNTSSRRSVKIRIPRLHELIESSTNGPNDPYCSVTTNVLYKGINAACRSAGLPEVGVHGLRRTFASLAYSLGWSEKATMQEGGWSDNATMNRIYIKLAESDAKKSSDSMEDFYSDL